MPRNPAKKASKAKAKPTAPTDADVRKLLDGIEKKQRELRADQRSTAAYWNCDSWGSMSGIDDAHNWVEGQLIVFVLNWVDRFREHRPARKARGK